MMRKHRHNAGHGPYPILSRKQELGQLTTIVASTSFSKRILEALSSGDVDLLNQYGFLDDFDLKGLSVNDLQAIVPGISSDVASLCVRIAALCKGPFASAAVSSAAAAPEALFSAPSVIQWKPGSSSCIWVNVACG